MVIKKILMIIFSLQLIKVGELLVLKIKKKKKIGKHILDCKIASNSIKAPSTRARFCLKIEIFSSHLRPSFTRCVFE